MTEPPVVVQRVTKEFRRRDRQSSSRATFRAVDDVSLEVTPNETMAIVGETGSGKSTLARIVTGIDRPTSGKVFLDGHDLWKLTGKRLRLARSRAHLIFQARYESLDPTMRVAQIIAEPTLADEN